MRYYLYILFFLLKLSFSFGQIDLDTSKIETAYAKCLDEDYSTAGMIGCTYEAELKYDTLMNSYYNLLLKDFETDTEKKKKIATALDMVAGQLGNTRTVCKKYYVHPVIISLYEQNAFKFLPVAYQHLYEEKEDNG